MVFVEGILCNDVVFGGGDLFLWRVVEFEVFEDKEAGESGGEEDQNQPQRTHFLDPIRKKERIWKMCFGHTQRNWRGLN